MGDHGARLVRSDRELVAWSWRADSGERIEVLDVVADATRDPSGAPAGAPAEQVAAVQAIHAHFFSDYAHVLADIETDAALPSRRRGVVVHQWLILVDDVPAGIVLSESNLVRGCAPVLFFAIHSRYRNLEVNRNRLAKLDIWLSVPQALRDGGADMLGVCGEREPDYPPRLVRLDVDYAEPIGGRHWSPTSGDLRPMSLQWLPPESMRPVVDVPGAGHDITCRIAAALLIDHYRMPRDHPHVRRLCGPQADLDVVVERWPGPAT
jgi:hypothetical protein